MQQKKAYKTASSFYSSPSNGMKPFSLRGQPYTRFPVPIYAENRDSSNGNPFSAHQQVFRYRSKQNNDQVRNLAKLQSADCKYRSNNPGLMNADRKINFNQYDDSHKYSEAEAIRQYGMNYRKKLHKQYNSPKFNIYQSRTIERKSTINHERQLKNWYEQRSEGMHTFHFEYLKKMQVQLGNSRQKAQQIFKTANQIWENQTVLQLKKCFQI